MSLGRSFGRAVSIAVDREASRHSATSKTKKIRFRASTSILRNWPTRSASYGMPRPCVFQLEFKLAATVNNLSMFFLLLAARVGIVMGGDNRLDDP